MSNVVQFPTDYDGDWSVPDDEWDDTPTQPQVILIDLPAPQCASVGASIAWAVLCGLVSFLVVTAMLS